MGRRPRITRAEFERAAEAGAAALGPTPPPDDRLILRFSNAARVLDMPAPTLRALIRRGDLPVVRVRRAVYVRTEDLRSWVAGLSDSPGEDT